MTQAHEPNRIASLDTIRGIAAMVVLLGHCAGSFAWPIGWANLPLINILFDGRSAVTMFFVLSGFVLSRLHVGSQRDGTSLKPLHVPTFYTRRITRIWIPWFAVFCLSAVAQNYFFHPRVTTPPTTEWINGFWHSSLSIPSVLKQCIFQLHDTTQQLLPQDWSLGVELKGSALIPIFVFLARKNTLLMLGSGIALLLCLPTGHYYLSFAIGVSLAAYYDRLDGGLRKVSFPWKVALLGLGVILYQSRQTASYFCEVSGTPDKIVWCISSVGCFLIILMSLSSRRIQKSLSGTAAVFLGKISYSLFLLQFLVLICLLPLFIAALNKWGISQPLVILPLAIGFSVFSTILLAAASYRLIEVPAIGLGRKLTTLIDRRPR